MFNSNLCSKQAWDIVIDKYNTDTVAADNYIKALNGQRMLLLTNAVTVFIVLVTLFVMVVVAYKVYTVFKDL